MQITMFKGKIHRATITQAELRANLMVAELSEVGARGRPRSVPLLTFELEWMDESNTECLSLWITHRLKFFCGFIFVQAMQTSS